MHDQRFFGRSDHLVDSPHQVAAQPRRQPAAWQTTQLADGFDPQSLQLMSGFVDDAKRSNGQSIDGGRGFAGSDNQRFFAAETDHSPSGRSGVGNRHCGSQPMSGQQLTCRFDHGGFSAEPIADSGDVDQQDFAVPIRQPSPIRSAGRRFDRDQRADFDQHFVG